jgi:hypothetical protein
MVHVKSNVLIFITFKSQQISYRGQAAAVEQSVIPA